MRWVFLKYSLNSLLQYSDFLKFQARRDAFKRRHPIAHAKKEPQDHELIPFRTDFLVIGGGLTGSSVAFWLKQRFRDEDMRVVVLEDPDKVS
jgi:hypothetical protein